MKSCIKLFELFTVAYFQMERHQKRVYLDLNYVFGSNFGLNLKNSLSFIEEDNKTKLIFTAGKTIVKRCLENNQMEFIKLSDNVESIQCIAISPSRNHIAVCEKIKNQSYILLNLYGLKTRDSEIKHFKLPQTEKQSTFKIIAFAPSQPKYACCITGEPEHQLIFLDISRSRGLAVSNFSVNNASSLAICPTQSHLVSVCGKNLFKLYKVEDYSFKANDDIKKLPKNRNFTTHKWFDKNKILIGTDRGELFIVGPVGNNFQVKKNYMNVFNQSQMQLSISELTVTSKGFILGSNFGNFSYWLKKEDSEQNFQDEYAGEMVKCWKVPENRVSEISCIEVDQQETTIGIGFRNNNIALVKIKNLQKDNDEVIPDEDLFTFIHDGFHEAAISSMDVCLHRPIIATLSKSERTIRLWNYKNPHCELVKRFDSKNDGIEEIGNLDVLSSLAIHPFGYYLAVGFCDKLRIYHILISELRNFKEIVLRGVCQLKFSNGGHMLAAAFSKQKYNIHLINVYNSYTLEELARLSDHSSMVTELAWKNDDRALYSIGADGFVIEWKYETKSENKEWACRKWSQANAKYTSGIYEKNAKSLLSAGQESGKNVVREFRLEKEAAQKIYTMGFRINKLQWLNSQWNIPAIIAGTECGAIKIFNCPFDNIVEQSINAHLKQITKIQVSPCGRYVFTVSEDSTIFIYQVSLTNREGFVSKRLHDQVVEYELNPLVGVLDDDLADIILIQRNNLNEKIRYIKMLEKNLKEMKDKIKIQDDESDKKHKSNLNRLETLLNEEINDLNRNFDNLKREKKELELKTQTKYMDTQNQNSKMLEQIEAMYEKKLTLQNMRYFELEVKFVQLKADNKKQIQNNEKIIKQSLEQLKNDFVETFKKAEKVHKNKQNQIIEGEKMYHEKVNQIEEEHEEELKRINKNINEIVKQKDLETAESLSKIQEINRQIKMYKEEIIELMSQNDRLEKFVVDGRAELKRIVGEINEKNDNLREKQEQMKTKEERIGEYQERIGDLQKKKQILSYRTWQMRQQVEPKEDEIQFLKEELYALENQFQNLLKDEKNLKETEKLINKDKQKFNKKISDTKITLKDKELKIKKICDEINNIVQSKSTDRKFYEEKMVELYHKYASLMTNINRINQNTKGNEEMSRHISHLKNEIGEVNEKTNQGLLKRDEDLRKATVENKNLIQELTRLREVKRKYQEELKEQTKVADNIKRHINQLKNSSLRNQSPMRTVSKKPSIKEMTQLPMLSKPALSKSASGPIKNKGKIAKGNNFDHEKLINMVRSKIVDMEERSFELKLEIKEKEMEFQMLKDIIREHVKAESCTDPLIDRTLNEFEV